jgi:hypothetical protein
MFIIFFTYYIIIVIKISPHSPSVTDDTQTYGKRTRKNFPQNLWHINFRVISGTPERAKEVSK